MKLDPAFQARQTHMTWRLGFLNGRWELGAEGTTKEEALSESEQSERQVMRPATSSTSRTSTSDGLGLNSEDAGTEPTPGELHTAQLSHCYRASQCDRLARGFSLLGDVGWWTRV
jgi:hypothetical protein